MTSYTKGNTLIEIVIVIAIMGLLVAVIAPAVSSFKDRQVLKNTTEEIIDLLNEARTNSISSKNATFYSVRFDPTRAVLFEGSTLVVVDPETKILTYDTAVTTPTLGVSLQGSGVDINFDRFTGNVATYGTISVQLASNPSVTKTITVSSLGVISSN